MRALDKTKIYDLSELTSEELKELAKYMQINHDWKNQVPHTDLFWHDASETWLYNKLEKVNDMVNAKELFYTLENIQVDCSELSEEQIKEMADVFEKKGYCYFENDKGFSLSIIDNTSYLHIYEGEIIIDSMVEGLKEITYDKFMELFGEQEVSKPTLSQYFKDLTPIDNPPFIKADSLGYIGQIVDNEEESSAVTPKEIVKYLSKKDIFLTPKQYKKLWKKS